MTQSVKDSISDIFKRALCDCLCTNIDLDLENAQNNTINVHVTPTKTQSSEESSREEIVNTPNKTNTTNVSEDIGDNV